jgi:hypothetical protein
MIMLFVNDKKQLLEYSKSAADVRKRDFAIITDLLVAEKYGTFGRRGLPIRCRKLGRFQAQLKQGAS